MTKKVQKLINGVLGMQYTCALDQSPKRPFAAEFIENGGPTNSPIDDKQGVISSSSDRGSGGWNPEESTADYNPYSTTKCTIDRRDVAHFTREAFIEEYASQGKQ
jgi:hypothetical protein